MAGAVAALVIAFLAAVAVIASVDIAGLTTCFDANRDPSFTGDECFDGSSKRKVVVLALAFPAAALAVVSFFLMAAFVIRGRGWKPAAITFGVGAILFGLSLAAGSIGA